MSDLRRTGKTIVELEILGEPASKANSRRAVLIGGKPRFIKSSKALDYSKYFIEQCPILDPLIQGPVFLDITIHYASMRPDLDESLILDLLQGRVYQNDRQVWERNVRRKIDRVRPRTRIHVEAMESIPGEDVPRHARSKSPHQKRGE